MTGLAVALLAVLVADHALKWLLLHALGPRSLSLGVFGEVRMRRAPIWILRVGRRPGPAVLWGMWLAGAGALLLVAAALPLPGSSIGLLLGGSLSHALETSRRGAVCDYVALHGWPAFDLADVALVVGASGTLLALAVAALGTLPA
jgi:signal peptidase II